MSLLSLLDQSHIREISRSHTEPEWLEEYRLRALEAYSRLPIETSPLYNKYTDAKRMDPEMVEIPASSGYSIPPALEKRLSEIERANHIVQAGTHIHRSFLSDDAASAGVVVSSIRDALDTHPDIVRAALDAADSADDRFTALNNAAFNSGVFIHVPAGTRLEAPVHILSCLTPDRASVVSRNVVSVGDGGSCTVIQELYSPGSSEQQSYLEFMSLMVGGGARLDGTNLQLMDPQSINFSTKRSDISKDGLLNWYLGLFGAALSRYRTAHHLNGNGAAVNDSEVAFGSGEQSFDMQTDINHHSPHTEGRVIEKSILRGRSYSLFKGMIRILENASKSNSYLSGRSILLDPDAKSDAIPGLEIFTNDVKATHSASVAQIDDEQIFYLGTRCLSRSDAERTIVEGFLEPLSRRMPIRVRAWIAYLIESKWEGRQLSINTDEELEKFTEIEETRYNENAEIEQHYKYR